MIWKCFSISSLIRVSNIFGDNADPEKIKDQSRGIVSGINQLRDAQKEYNDAVAQGELDRANGIKATNLAITKDEKATLQNRLSAYQAYQSILAQDAKDTRNKEIANADAEGDAAEKKLKDGVAKTQDAQNALYLIIDSSQQKRINAETKYQSTVTKIFADGEKAQSDIVKSASNENIKQINLQLSERKAANDKLRDAKLADARKSLDNSASNPFGSYLKNYENYKNRKRRTYLYSNI